MQTFLPYPDFASSASVLDRQRLGKQRLETKQILQTLLGISSGWANHPAVKMWEGYEHRLTIYGLYVCSEWRFRGYEDNLFTWFEERRKDFVADGRENDYPSWFGERAFHTSHQKKLVWKAPSHYADIFGLPDEPFGEPEYIWPI